MRATEKPFETDPRIDTLMSVLVTLHERGVLTDPAVSTTREPYGLRVEVEFLLDFDESIAGRVEVSQTHQEPSHEN